MTMLGDTVQLIEMFVNENEDETGIYATSVVESPATESEGVFLKKQNLAGFDPNQKRNKDGEWGDDNSIDKSKKELPETIEGNDGIIWTKTGESNGLSHYIPIYKGQNIDTGGFNFRSRKELDDFIKDYVVSIQIYKKYRSLPSLNPRQLSSYKDIKLAEVDGERQILMGALLVPDKPILRQNEKGESYYIFFSKDTLTKIMGKFMRKGMQNNTTEEHSVQLEGNTIVEIWQKESLTQDKSAIYGLEDPVGSIMATMKIPDKQKFQEFKASKKGFSLEGNFTDEIKLSKAVKPTKDTYSDAMLRLILARVS